MCDFSAFLFLSRYEIYDEHQQQHMIAVNLNNSSSSRPSRIFFQANSVCWNSAMDEQNNSVEWDASILHYAANYPYIPLDDRYLKLLLNHTRALSLNTTGNSTFSEDECSRDAVFNLEFLATLHVMYWTIFIIAILGNGMVCFIVCQSSRMQTVTNYFIANLALADMSMAFLCIPSSFISQSIQWVSVCIF